jgi:hypothetical protein
LALVALPKINQDTIETEDLRFRKYLEERGFDTRKMGLVEEISDREIGAEGVVGEKS